MASKRPQLRRCKVCQNVGHNKATCPNATAISSSVEPKPANSAPLKFFVHHVNAPAPSSPHVVDLKTPKNDLWNIIESAAPDNTIATTFQKYHESKNEKPEINPDLFSKLHKNEEPKLDLHNLEIISEKPKSGFKIPQKHYSLPKLKLPKVEIPRISKSKLKISTLKFVPLATAALVFAFIVPNSARGYFQSLTETKTVIAENSTAGFMALQESATALKSADVDGAEKSTAAALDKFSTALSTLASKHTVLQAIAGAVPVLHGEIESREKILLAGEEIALGNSYVLSTLKKLENEKDLPITEKLNRLVEALRAADPNYKKALENLNEVDPQTVPVEYQERFADFKVLFTQLAGGFNKISDLNDSFQEIFGGKGLRRYLLIFQNPAELRPTGGFMGSFAVMDVKDGKIANLDIPAGGTYDLQGQLPDYLIPPLPLTISNKRWEFQDSNWYPDFPASAEKILWFYNRGRGVTADGVIAINATVLEKLLGIVGPISDQTRGLSLSENNALTTIQTVVETGPEKKQNKPKQILSDLAPQLLGAIQSSPGRNLLPLLSELETALEEKDIQAYFTDKAAENLVESSGWAGTVSQNATDTDYLFVVNTNLRGQKSDARMKQTISHEAVISNDGTITDTVIITREHTGSPTEQFYGSTNIDYLRMYVPAGSTLLSASGFTWPDEKAFRAPDNWYTKDPDLSQKEQEIGVDQSTGTRITSEFNKTAFGNWIITEPGQISRVEFKYQLPFKIVPTSTPDTFFTRIISDLNKPSIQYQLFVQKQSGITSDFESQIVFPTSWEPSWYSGSNVALASNGLHIKIIPLTNDSVWSILMKSNQ